MTSQEWFAVGYSVLVSTLGLWRFLRTRKPKKPKRYVSEKGDRPLPEARERPPMPKVKRSREQLKDDWQERYKGTKNAGEIAVVETGPLEADDTAGHWAELRRKHNAKHALILESGIKIEYVEASKADVELIERVHVNPPAQPVGLIEGTGAEPPASGIIKYEAETIETQDMGNGVLEVTVSYSSPEFARLRSAFMDSTISAQEFLEGLRRFKEEEPPDPKEHTR